MAGHWIYPRSLDLRLPQRHGLRLWLRLRRWQGKPFGCWQGKLFGRWQGELLRGWQSTLLRWRTSASRCSALFCLQLCVHPSLHQAFVRGPHGAVGGHSGRPENPVRLQARAALAAAEVDEHFAVPGASLISSVYRRAAFRTGPTIFAGLLCACICAREGGNLDCGLLLRDGDAVQQLWRRTCLMHVSLHDRRPVCLSLHGLQHINTNEAQSRRRRRNVHHWRPRTLPRYTHSHRNSRNPNMSSP